MANYEVDKIISGNDSYILRDNSVADGYIPNEGNAKTDVSTTIVRGSMEAGQGTGSTLLLNKNGTVQAISNGGSVTAVASETTGASTINLGQGGNVAIQAQGQTGNVTITGSGNVGQVNVSGTGAVSATSSGGDITVQTTKSNGMITISAPATGGDINVGANDDINLSATTGNIKITAFGSVGGNKGDISLTANSNDIDITATRGNTLLYGGSTGNDGRGVYVGSTSNPDCQVAIKGDLNNRPTQTEMAQAITNATQGMATQSDLSGYIPNAGNTVDGEYHTQRTGTYQIRMRRTGTQYVSDSYKSEYTGGTVQHSVWGNVNVTGGSTVQVEENVEVTAGHNLKVKGSGGSTDINIINSQISGGYTTIDFANDTIEINGCEYGQDYIDTDSSSFTIIDGSTTLFTIDEDTGISGYFYSIDKLFPSYRGSATLWGDINNYNSNSDIVYPLSANITDNLGSISENCRLTVIGDGRYKIINTETLPATGVYFMQYPTNSEVIFDGVTIEDYDNIFNPVNIPNTRTNVTFKNCFFTSTQTFNLPVSAYGTIAVENCVFVQDVQIIPRMSMKFSIKDCVFKGTTGLSVQAPPTGYEFTGQGIITNNHFETAGAGVTVSSILTGIYEWNN